jgi:hypothetical protein
MVAKRIAWILVGGVLGVGTAHAVEVHKTGMAKGTPAEVWQAIGDFCAIGDWHPAVDTCAMSEDAGVIYRTLNLAGGGTIREKLIETTDTGYTYEIVESPLPVENYRSTFAVKAEGDGTAVDWSGSFDAKGASDADAEGVIAGIYTAGLDSISAMGGN